MFSGGVRRREWLGLGGLFVALSIGAAPSATLAQTRVPDLTGIWAVPNFRLTEPGFEGVYIQTGAVGWAPLSAGAPETRKVPTIDEQKAYVVRLRVENLDNAAIRQRNALRAPFNEEGAKATADRVAANKEALASNPYAACRPRNGIGVPSDDFQIVQSKDRLVLGYPDGLWRTIHLGPNREADPLPTYLGYSRGRWENGALVVETTHFLGDVSPDGWAMSDKAKVTETFTVTPQGRLNVKTVYEDPEYLREPVGRFASLERQPGNRQIVIANCVELVDGDLEYRKAFADSGNQNTKSNPD